MEDINDPCFPQPISKSTDRHHKKCLIFFICQRVEYPLVWNNVSSYFFDTVSEFSQKQCFFLHAEIVS
jgi:hypothetical protein